MANDLPAREDGIATVDGLGPADDCAEDHSLEPERLEDPDV